MASSFVILSALVGAVSASSLHGACSYECTKDTDCAGCGTVSAGVCSCPAGTDAADPPFASCTCVTKAADPVPPNTLADFGYYFGLTPTDKLSLFANHSTCAFVSGSNSSQSVAFLRQLKGQQMSGILAITGVFFKNESTLWPDWVQRWQEFWSVVSLEPNILALYPYDEPQLSSGVYAQVVRKIKSTAPRIPIAAVVTASAVEGIEFGAYDLPIEVDWVGFDNYGCWAEEECVQTGHCCWENRTIPHNLGVIKKYVTNRGGKMFVVPDGMESVTSKTPCTDGKLPPPPSLSDQSLRAARDRKYYNYCLAEEHCVAMWVFLWNSVCTSAGWITGVDRQPEVLLPALVGMGTEIKDRQRGQLVHEDNSRTKY